MPISQNYPGLFIELSGGEGAGKSSSMAEIVRVLEDAGRCVVQTREPGGTEGAEAIRGLLLASTTDLTPYAELLLMQAARAEHVERLIRPALGEGKTVVSDRYLGSTIAYQGAGRGLCEARINSIHDQTAALRPDLTILLDIDPVVGLKRSLKRLDDGDIDEGRFEKLDLEFHYRVRESFLRQAEKVPSIIVDAGQPIERVHADIQGQIRAWLSKHG